MRHMVVRICKNGHEVTRDDLFYCPVCRSVELRTVGEPGEPVEPSSVPAPVVAAALATRQQRKRDEALARLRSVGGWGVVLYVVGVVIWVVALNALDDVDSGGGALFGLLVGGLTASVGAAMVLVFLIGFGVKLGREAADL